MNRLAADRASFACRWVRVLSSCRRPHGPECSARSFAIASSSAQLCHSPMVSVTSFRALTSLALSSESSRTYLSSFNFKRNGYKFRELSFGQLLISPESCKTIASERRRSIPCLLLKFFCIDEEHRVNQSRANVRRLSVILVSLRAPARRCSARCSSNCNRHASSLLVRRLEMTPISTSISRTLPARLRRGVTARRTRLPFGLWSSRRA